MQTAAQILEELLQGINLIHCDCMRRAPISHKSPLGAMQPLKHTHSVFLLQAARDSPVPQMMLAALGGCSLSLTVMHSLPFTQGSSFRAVHALRLEGK